MKHTVKAHRWIEGRLHVITHEFEKLEHALGFLSMSKHESAKIINERGQVVHETGSSIPETYA